MIGKSDGVENKMKEKNKWEGKFISSILNVFIEKHCVQA